MTSMKEAFEEIKKIKEKQGNIILELGLVSEREKHAIEERKHIFSAIEWIKANMATKEDMGMRLKMIESVDEDLKEHVKETQTSINNLKESQERSMRNLEGIFSSAIEKLKNELMPVINKTAQESGNGMLKQAFLTGKFTIVYAILYLLISAIIGGAIVHFFKGVE